LLLHILISTICCAAPNGGAKRFAHSGARLAAAQRGAQIRFSELLAPRESAHGATDRYSRCMAPS